MDIKFLALLLFVIIGFCLYVTFKSVIVGQGESSEITYDQILELKPDIIYIAGKSASGKTTLSDKLANNGYHVLHVDEIIREGFDGLYPTKWGASFELHEKITNLLANAIDSTQKPIILEGIIHKPVLTILINKYNPTLIWVQHRTRESYIKAVKQRAAIDIESNKQGNALGAFWGESNAEAAIEDYKQHGVNGAIFTKYIEEDVDYNLSNLAERRESLFKDWNYRIYYTNIV